jgi:hypothetical protein
MHTFNGKAVIRLCIKWYLVGVKVGGAIPGLPTQKNKSIADDKHMRFAFSDQLYNQDSVTLRFKHRLKIE